MDPERSLSPHVSKKQQVFGRQLKKKTKHEQNQQTNVNVYVYKQHAKNSEAFKFPFFFQGTTLDNLGHTYLLCKKLAV